MGLKYRSFMKLRKSGNELTSFSSFIAKRYHKSGDDYFESWTQDGVKQALDLIGQIMAELANNGDYPKYYDGVSFGN